MNKKIVLFMKHNNKLGIILTILLLIFSMFILAEENFPPEETDIDLEDGSSSSSSGGGSTGEAGGEANPNPPNEYPTPSYEESFLINTEKNHLEMFEPLGSIYSYFGKDELDILADGSFSNELGTEKYYQYLFFPKDVNYVKYAENDNGDITDNFLFFKNNNQLARYKLEFISPVRSRIEDNHLIDLINNKIIILGKEYTINNALRIGNFIRLELKSGEDVLALEDNDFSNDNIKGFIQINGKTISGAEANINAYLSDPFFKLLAIEVIMNAEDDYYVPDGKLLSETINAAGEDPAVLFTNNWDIQYLGLAIEPVHDLKLSASSNRKYKLIWYDGDNNKVEMPLVYAKNSNQIQFSEDIDENALVLKEGIPLKKNDYFVVTGGNPEDGTAKSYLLQYKGADNIGKTSPKIKFKNIGSTETLEYQVSNGNEVCTIKLGGNSFIVKNASKTSSDDFEVFVDLDITETTSDGKSVYGTLQEGIGTQHQILGDKEYFTKLVYVDGTYAKFTVNGEITDKLKIGDAYILNDNTKIEVSSILYQSFAGGIHSASFILSEPLFASHIGISDDQVFIVDNYGAQISFSDYLGRLVSLDNVSLTISTPNQDDYGDIKPLPITLTIGAMATDKVTISSIAGLVNPLITPEGETNVAYGYTSMGGKLIYETPLDSPSSFTYEYPENQRLAQVFILSKKEEVCQPNWILENNWSECKNSIQSKNYYDTNGCGNPAEQPAPLNQSCEDEFGGYVCPAYSEGIVVHKINFTKQFAIPDNTYEHGWKFNFFMTVPENENIVKMWVDDWVNGDKILPTNGNVKIIYNGNDYAVGSAHDYSDSESFVAVDKYPDCPGRQIDFDVLVKMPENTPYGYYSTSYGIQSLEPIEEEPDVSIDNDPMQGDVTAPVTMVMFCDFECPFCAKYVQEIHHKIRENYIETGKVRFVSRDFPLSFHPQAESAAIAAECAHEQDKYWGYHDKLLENQADFGVENFKVWANELGLDTEQFNTCLDTEKYQEEVENDIAEGKEYGVLGTPTFFINGQIINGAQSYELFKQAIEDALGNEAEPELPEEEPVEENFAQKTWAVIYPGKTTIVEVENEGMGITNISFSVEETTYGAWMKIEKISGLPSWVESFSGKVYKYIDVTKGLALKDNIIKDAKISFKVEKTWLNTNKLTKENVTLFRYEATWTKLGATVSDEDDEFIYYAAETPGFGYFVIGEKEE